MSLTYKDHKVKNSVGYKLLKIVFSVYVLIALIITAFHMYSEYKNTKNIIFEDMLNIENSFEPQIANGVWHYDEKLINQVMNGILSNRTIIGVSIRSEDNLFFKNSGIIDIKHKNLKNDSSSIRYKSDLFSHHFEFGSKNYNNGKKLGVVHIYSDESIIYDIVKNNFRLIVINSLLKTLALWLIFLYFSQKYLTKPFYEIIRSLSEVNFKDIKTMKVLNQFHDHSEFESLENSFNKMLYNLEHSYKQLQVVNEANIELNKTLEQKVNDRTYELEKTIQTLKDTQSKLIQSEKMASLGGLVTGVAHEINTPVGNSLTGITYLNDSLDDIQVLYDKNQISEDEFKEFLDLSKNIITSRKCRNQIKKAQKSGLITINCNSAKSISEFYKLYADNMFRHGTPAFGMEFFEVLSDSIECDFIITYLDETPVSSVVVVYDENIALAMWAGINSNYLKYSPNHSMYWKAIELAINKDKEIFDFGRSGYGSPIYKFKLQWGAMPIKIDILENSQSDIYKKYSHASTIWKRLPRKIVDFIGPKLCRYLKDL